MTRVPSVLGFAALLILSAPTSAQPTSSPATRPTSAPATLPATSPAGVVGDWIGTLKTGPTSIRLVLHLRADAAGRLGGTMDSIDQLADGLPIDVVTFESGTLLLTMPRINGRYEGKLAAATGDVVGVWKQGESSLPLTFKRTTEIPVLRRPQEPARPLPYDEEEVRLDSTIEVKLSGTLTKPRGAGPFPAVVLITGSGPQDRDEMLMGHRPFLVLADYLTRRGVVVLRCDDRGVGKSTGDFGTATVDDFAADALAAVAYLKARPGIAKDKIGLIGHSEGGVSGPIAAAKSPDVAFLVMLAGVGVKVDELLIRQGADVLRAEGATPGRVERSRRTSRDLFRLLREDPKPAVAIRAVIDREMAALSPEERVAAGSSKAVADAQIAWLTSPGFARLVKYDPSATLGKVKCPVLAINGDKDVQVASDANLPAINAALTAGGNKDVTTVELKGLNHLFQPSTTGRVSEYGQIEVTFDRAALDVVGEWIGKRVK